MNWFRKDDDGSFLWPGFGENARVLKWVLERVSGHGEAREPAIGMVPTVEGIDRSGIDVDDGRMAKLLDVDETSWLAELELIKGHFNNMGRTPACRAGPPTERPGSQASGLNWHSFRPELA